MLEVFNFHIKKKEAIRRNELSNLQDKVCSQMRDRITNKGDCFDNQVLLKYYQALEASLNKIDQQEEIKIPQIQINQQLNINTTEDSSTLDRDSRQRVIDAVRDIIKKAKQEALKPEEQIDDIESREIIDGDYRPVHDEDTEQQGGTGSNLG